MPTIDVVPNSTSISAPGWAYVPDNGYDPSKAAIQPSGARKRVARASGVAGGGTTTTRQHNAILKHIAELDRENYKDVQIAIPSKAKENAGRVTKSKSTTNVRRILMSQKTFANHLADEEAALAAQHQNPPSLTLSRSSISKPAGTPSAQKRSSLSEAPSGPLLTPGSQRPSSSAVGAGPSLSSLDPSHDPLLKSCVPCAPSKAVMEALLSAPPLSYSAARAAPSTYPTQRHFCEICGYWGLYKCMKCGARYCGTLCKEPHEKERCLKFYA